MFQGQRVVVCIPSGRKRYLRCLIPYLLDKRADIVDEVQLWVNTDVDEDLAFLQELETRFAPRIKRVTVLNKLRPAVYNEERKHVQYNDTICHFYRSTVEKDTLYVKLDDDMVYVHPDFFPNLCAEALKERERCYLFICNMFNVSMTTKIHQGAGVVSTEQGTCTGDLRCPVACTDGRFAVFIHERFLDMYAHDELAKLSFESFDVRGRQRIGAIAWFGEMFTVFKGIIDSADEKYLTQELGKMVAPKPMRVVGNALVSHFASAHQLAELEDNSDVLERYRAICVNETGLEL